MWSGPLVVAIERDQRPKIARTIAPLTFHGRRHSVTVPEGFETDLASIPRWALWLINPLEPHASAAVIHDRVYVTHELSRGDADALFYEAMRASNVPAWKARVMFCAVRVGGVRGWKSDHVRTQEGAPMPQKTSPDGISLIKEFEGCHRRRPDGKIEAYLCPEKVPTIGYGSTKGVKLGMVIDEAMAETMLAAELAPIEAAIDRYITVPLTQSQHDALVSWLYNVGIGWLGAGGHKPATLVKKLNQGDYAAVSAELLKFVRGAKSGKAYDGLRRRRQAEADLWRKGALSSPVSGQDDPPPVSPQAIAPETPATAIAERLKGSWSITGLLTAFGGTVVTLYERAIDTLLRAATEVTAMTKALGGVGLDAKTLGVSLIGIGILVALVRQFQPRTGGST